MFNVEVVGLLLVDCMDIGIICGELPTAVIVVLDANFGMHGHWNYL